MLWIGHVISVVPHVKIKDRNYASTLSIHRTNIPRKSIDLNHLFLIYRQRRQMELYAKCLRRGNLPQSITHLNVILLFITICILSSMCNNYFWGMSKLKRGYACLQFSNLTALPLYLLKQY